MKYLLESTITFEISSNKAKITWPIYSVAQMMAHGLCIHKYNQI